jgi:tetratricopeptide (TPR) repeat protein
MKKARTILFILLATAAPASAGLRQETEISPDVTRMVRDGMTEALEARFGAGRNPTEKQLLARAWASRARRTADRAARARWYDETARKYRAWVTELEDDARVGLIRDSVALAAARVEFGNMILAGQVSDALNAFEFSGGKRGDREQLADWFEEARQLYREAERDTQDLVEGMARYEEELLAAGVYDLLRQTRLDLSLNLGWANYYLGLLEDDAARGAESLGAAERRFRQLVMRGASDETRSACYLGLAMTQREQGRYADATDNFRNALRSRPGATVELRVRYELGRSQLREGKFDEARTTMRPLTDKDLRSLRPEDRPARRTISLAHLWHARSYLDEAARIAESARTEADRIAAQRRRERGLTLMKNLSELGSAWRDVVQLHVSTSVDLDTPMRELGAIELLFTAGMLMDASRYRPARDRLQAAIQRPDTDPDVMAEVLYALGRCQYQLHAHREAAEAFARLAREHRSHARAPQAATFAYQLWGKVAKRSREPDDYLALAACLRNLIESFADHPQRREAEWLLPVALQLAGRYEVARHQFAKVPTESGHWEEAQYRAAMCQRQIWEQHPADLGPADRKRQAVSAAEALLGYAMAARERAVERRRGAAQVLDWSARACVAGAELLVAEGIEDHERALRTLATFESHYPESELLGRALAVRIRALRGLRRFEEAAAMLGDYLQTASPERAGATLAALAQGMQDEVTRLSDAGDEAAARALAADAVGTFEQLEAWVRADAERERFLAFVLQGRARMLYLARRYEEAEQVVDALLEIDRRRGAYRELRAEILLGLAEADAPEARVRAARDAWAVLLNDPAIRQRAPQRYWKALRHWLALSLRLGEAASVEQTIDQERIWHADLGGPPWQAQIEKLYREARVAQSKPPTTQPAGMEEGTKGHRDEGTK